MLDFLFKNKKEYVSCKWLEYGIHLGQDGISHCCCYYLTDNNYMPVERLGENHTYALNNFLEKKKEDRNSFRHGNIISRCENCDNLSKKAWDSENKIKEIAISSNTACNADCIYCSTHRNKKYYNSCSDIPYYDLLKSLFDKELITSDCNIQFGGGEPTLHDEFEKVVELISNRINSKVTVFSSGIKYSKGIEKLILLNKCNLIISLDSGNSILYKKIKNVDKFYNIIDNVKRYCEAQSKTIEPTSVSFKYIIIPGVNDTEENILEFLLIAKSIGVNAVRCEVEHSWYKQNKFCKDKIKDILHLIHFFDKKSKEISLWHFPNPIPLLLMNKNLNL